MGRDARTDLPGRSGQRASGVAKGSAAGWDISISGADWTGGTVAEGRIAGLMRLFGRILTLPLTGLGASARSLAEVIEDIERFSGKPGPEIPRGPEPAVVTVRQEPQRAPEEAAPPAAQPAVARVPAAAPVLHEDQTAVIRKEKQMDKDLRDDMLKLVKYRILFVKREYETAFHEHEDVIEDNLDGGALTAWKIAEFMQHLTQHGERIPSKWGDTYPPNSIRVEPPRHAGYDPQNQERRFYGFPEEDKKYLRVSYEILERYPRERFKYEEQQIKILEEMRDQMRRS